MLGRKSLAAAALAAGMALAAVSPALAGTRDGNFMVRVQGTVIDPDASAKVYAGNNRLEGANADVSTEVVPTMTLTYFFNKNLAVELLCCAAKLEAKGKGTIDKVDLGDFWIFPPALTLQYHFDNFHGFKPYVGAGIQYIHFFKEGRGGIGRIRLDDAVGFTLQAGVDIELGDGWYLNADVKKTWIDTDASWKGTDITAKVDVDPWIYSVGIGYRFNLEDIFGHRYVEHAALK